MDSLYSQGATNQNAMNALYTVGAVGAREADPLLDLRLRLDELMKLAEKKKELQRNNLDKMDDALRRKFTTFEEAVEKLKDRVRLCDRLKYETDDQPTKREGCMRDLIQSIQYQIDLLASFAPAASRRSRDNDYEDDYEPERRVKNSRSDVRPMDVDDLTSRMQDATMSESYSS